MKLISIIISLLLCGLIPGYAQQRHSLIIALSDYAKYGHYWKNLNSENDAEVLKAALLKANFEARNIHIVTKAETKADMIRAIKEQLLDKVKAGDFVHFHFSGHGQQVADYSLDERDGFDEALVPLSAPLKPKYKDKSGKEVLYSGDAHLIDDELGAILTKVRNILGVKGKLLVTIDACHSGTMTRGLQGVPRGSDIKIKPDNFQAPEFSGDERNWIESPTSVNSARMVTFYACGSQESNYEITGDDDRKYGPLSLSLASAISEGYMNGSFEELFARVQQRMAARNPHQSPLADGLDFGESQPFSFQLTHSITDWKAGGQFEIGSGFLMGITKGSILEGKTKSGDKWRAKVIESSPVTARSKVYGTEPSNLKTSTSLKLVVPSFKGSGETICTQIERKDDEQTIKRSLSSFDFGTQNCVCELSVVLSR